MTIKKTTVLTGDAVRTVCIQNEYFTNGTNKQYENMLKYADKYSELGCMNDLHIYEIAKSIVEHTEWLTRDYTKKECIENVMFLLSKASNTHYTIEE